MIAALIILAIGLVVSLAAVTRYLGRHERREAAEWMEDSRQAEMFLKPVRK